MLSFRVIFQCYISVLYFCVICFVLYFRVAFLCYNFVLYFCVIFSCCILCHIFVLYFRVIYLCVIFVLYFRVVYVIFFVFYFCVIFSVLYKSYSAVSIACLSTDNFLAFVWGLYYLLFSGLGCYIFLTPILSYLVV